MKKFICLMVLIYSFTFSGAQFKEPVVDSIYYYQKELSRIQRVYRDSQSNDPVSKNLRENISRLRTETDNYRAFALYVQISSADFQILNADNGVINFGPLSGPMFGIGYGFSLKKNRRIFDFNVSAFGIPKKTKNGDESIRTSFWTYLQFEWGYDFIKSRTINIYPFAGFGLRQSSLEYKTPGQRNPAPTAITNIVQNNPSVNDQYAEIGYQAGLGFEFVLTRSSNPGGVLVFIKAGTNRPFSKKSFNLEGFRYNPELNYGEWNITTGFKFFGR